MDTPATEIAPSAVGKVHAAICAIMGEIGGIGKGRRSGQGYNYRGIADLYLATQPLMAKHGLHIIPHAIINDSRNEGETKSGGKSVTVRMRVQYRAYHADGSFIQVETIGEANDTGDKASNKAMSVAMKYALIQLFAIPEEDPAIDTEYEGGPKDNEDPTRPVSEASDGKAVAPNGISKDVADKISDAMTRAGIKKDSKDRLAWISGELKRHISKYSDITAKEGADLLVAIGKIISEKAVVPGGVK